MAEYYAGIDLGARSSWLCVVDAKGVKRLNRRIANDPAQILAVLDPFRGRLRAVVESTFNWYWLVDLLQDHEIEVKLAHPLYLKAIAYAKVKTDQVDAHTLAQLLRLDYIPEAFIYPRDLRPTRNLLRRRHRLVSWRSDLYRVLHFHLISHNITTFGRNAIKQLDGRHLRGLLTHAHDRRASLAMLHLIASLDQEIAELDEQVSKALFRKKPVVLLKTIPGVGKVLAATIYLEVGQIHRFASDKAFASYCRLAPTVSQSGAVTRQGKNRRQGNRLLKWAFSEAAQMAVQRYPQIREQFHRLLKRKKKRILAKSILAHKLAVAAFHVLSDEQPCRPGLLIG
jgi:transposase